jgi:uncharacterized lipoprotein YajG
MKLISTLIAILLITGCTSMKPVEMSPDQLQDGISSGEVVHEGDTVRITTADGKKHKFEVTAISDERIAGNDIEILVVDIVAIELKEHSDVKSGALFVSSMAVILLAAAAAAAF